MIEHKYKIHCDTMPDILEVHVTFQDILTYFIILLWFLLFVYLENNNVLGKQHLHDILLNLMIKSVNVY